MIFHKLRDYDSHLIIKEVSKFDVKVKNTWLSQLMEVWFLLIVRNL